MGFHNETFAMELCWEFAEKVWDMFWIYFFKTIKNLQDHLHIDACSK